jgi:phosphate transport system protein
MRVFDDELRTIKDKLLTLGSMVETAVKNSIHALVERDSNLAHEVIKNDDLINKLDLEIEEECVRLIALRQPKASDLRLLSTAIKIITDLERIGDLAVNIAERALELNEEPQLKPYIDIPRMAEMAQEMLRDSLDMFIAGCKELPADFIEKEKAVDDLNVQVFNELLMFMIQDQKTITRATRISYISKYLERIADHATNIAEDVIYMCKGKMIRHTQVFEEE